MDFVRDHRLGVALFWGVVLVLAGVVACDSSQEVVEPTATMIRDTPTAVVEPTATAVVDPEPDVVVVEPTATTVPATATKVVEPTAAEVVEREPDTPVVEPTATMVAATPTAVIDPTPTMAPRAATPVSPTATAEAEAEVTAEVDPFVSSLADRVYELTLMFAEELSPRQSATDEELEAAMYLLAEMEDLGYEVEIQDFEVTDAWGSGRLEILPGAEGGEPNVKFSRRDGETERIFFVPFDPLKPGIVEGEMVEAGLGYDEDYEGIDVDGKIALVSRGDITFEEKETNAAANGAIGVVVYNNEPQYYFGGRLDQEPDIFAGGIPKEDGELLVDALDDGESIRAELMVYPLGNGPSRNVVAELNNDIHDDKVVLIGAHYDTTPWTQGANDNGSGMAAAIVLAEELVDDDLPFDLRFVFFGSEETGLHGSTHYVEELTQAERGRIEAMINLDVVATGDLSAEGTLWLIGLAMDAADESGIDFASTGGLDGATSDHAPFDERGVSVLMLYADDLRFVNHPDDTVEHLDTEPMGQTVAVVLGMVERLADSIEP